MSNFNGNFSPTRPLQQYYNEFDVSQMSAQIEVIPQTCVNASET